MASSYSRGRNDNRRRLASSVRGTGRFRKLLRRLPDNMRAELLVELRVTGRQLRQAVRAKAPNRRGDLRAGITDRVLPRSLRLQIGLLGTPAGRAKLFYGRIQDLGRRQQVVRVTRRSKILSRTPNSKIRASRYEAGKGRQRRGRGKLNLGQLRRTGDPYPMAVKAMPAKRFVTGRYPELRDTLRSNLRGIFSRALTRLSEGGDE